MATSLMSMQVKIENDARPQLQALGLSLENFPEEFRQIGEYLTEFFAGPVFSSQGGEIGESWPGLSADYAKWKQAMFPGQIVLERSGAMRTNFVDEPENQKVTVRNLSDYFGYHQTGTSKMPKRVMMKLDQKRREKISEIFTKGIQRKIDQAVAHGRP